MRHAHTRHAPPTDLQLLAPLAQPLQCGGARGIIAEGHAGRPAHRPAAAARDLGVLRPAGGAPWQGRLQP